MTVTSKAIVIQARSWLGTKYHHQGRLKKSTTHLGGVDCIGLIIGVARELGISGAGGNLLSDFDETGYSAYPDGVSLKRFLDQHLRIVSCAKIRPGDVLLFKLFEYPQHVGIATPYQMNQNRVNQNCGGKLGIIHCYSCSGQVVEHLLSPAWQRMLVAGYRFRRKK